ncbi:S9 family peptidase [Mongoliibacter ruber]|uniref:Dipeptidyl aminopeptidase/acylaminoacyl peptidase n=1 Tax=Mongoliibacter ruber TaxID=1750599 RepID=A0A2T0WG79_9BACT|nr:prolyl oligopeptidase family serine peptidase [Mongoliibacter ruber]PRY85720.1 dipeptidyl aminopeptidase/acylaminoacyl peptidase [Mongoliibacter ruber]
MIKYNTLKGIFSLIVISLFLANGGMAQDQKPMSWKDVPSWKSISQGSVQFSKDGKWMAYGMVLVEGDGEVIIQKVNDPESKKSFPIGSSSNPSISFSDDGRWVAFKEYPKEKDKKAASKNGGKNLKEKLVLIDLQHDYKKTEYDNIASFSFNGKSSSHLAINLSKEGANGDAKGSDLLIVNLSNLKSHNIGNVLEFAFNKSGEYLAYTIDAANKNGNGLHLYQVGSGNINILETDKATYRSINWTEKGDAFALLKMVDDKAFKQDQGKVIGVKNPNKPELVLYDPKADSTGFPKDFTISPNRKPMWSEDLSRLFYGIHPLVAEKKDDKKEEKKEEKTEDNEADKLGRIMADTTIKSISDLQSAIAKLDTGKTKSSTSKGDPSKPDMTIWHWKDSRLQSRQQVLENQDKNYSFWAMYQVSDAKHIALQDSSMKDLQLLPKQKFALGSDLKQYELDINLDGQNYYDYYVVDLSTGERKELFTKFYQPNYNSRPRPSEDGTKLLYAEDGHFYLYDIPSGKKSNLTEKIATTFVNVEDDRNVEKPMNAPLGWSSDSKFVLLRDNWDIWQVPVSGTTTATNLTQNGKTDKIRYQSRFSLDPEEKGIDLSKGLYVRLYGENNKMSGIGKINSGKNGLNPGVEKLIWEEANINRLSKAENADVYFFTKEKFSTPTDYFVTGPKLENPKKLTSNAPNADKYAWSSGVQLVDYVSDKGDSLQAALFLPAGYEEGKKYPTLVYYYEKLSQTLHNYSSPGFSGTGWNPGIYTSNGYAVLIPDIVYTLDDPGMSAVWCVLPAVKEALKTGVIDEKKMGLHGHSWGGYQTSFLITQTDMFKAAAAGAPLTNMVSMYDLIYWNTGGGNMAIFEASQGRFRGGPWENWDSYLRNSPVYHVKNVKTPLLMLHNDKDGAVDFTQGIEYYNALRRLKKPVIMVQYKGENHGLSKLENRKDYSVRMMEFFDHHLKGNDAPQWISEGVDRLKLDTHLEQRVF